MDLDDAIAFARTTHRSVLVTSRRDGRPQLSNVLHSFGPDGVLRVSVTATRAKYRNLLRDPWAALHVTRDDFFAYAVLEGTVELTPIIESVDDPGVEEHVDHYRAAVGEHDDWDAYRKSLIAEQRSLVHLRPTRAYGMLDLAKPDEG
jgi:PPOX class probable F420-dependent enzyme